MFHKKQIFKLHTLKKLLAEENGCVSLVPCTRLLALPPFFLNDLKSGILYQLNSLLKKYDRSLGGIIIGYQNIKILMDENTGIIPMGTPETEVNIKVEFYVFQPKIGSYLQGAVNKRSSNHIGCLVHRYFNATILKPEEVDVEDWVGKNYTINDKILFRVKDLDFTGLLPSIEGILDDENLLVKNNGPKSPTDISPNDRIICSINNISFSSELLSKIERNDNSEDEFLKKEKSKDKTNTEKEECQEIVKSVQQNSCRSDGEKEKRKAKVEPAKENVIVKQTEDFNLLESTSGCVNVKLQTDVISKEKKKKKKEKESKAGSFKDNEENERKEKAAEDSLSLGKYVELENDNSNDFMTPVKLKEKKKKKKEKNDESFNKSFEHIHSKREDNVLYSTQLEPNSDSKMVISFCSPIPCGNSMETQDGETAVGNKFLALTSKNKSLRKEEEKKKSKKRKREQVYESGSAPKRIKTCTLSPGEEEDTNIEKSETEKIIEELYKRQLSIIGDTSSIVHGESQTKKNVELSRNESFQKLKVDKDSDPDMSGVNRVMKIGGEHDQSCGLICQNLKISVDRGKETVKKSKKSSKSKLSGAEIEDRIDTMHGKLDGLNNEKDKVKKSSSKNQKREKKSKTSESEKGEKKEVINDLLYNKLARSGLSLENENQLSFQQTKEVGKRKNKKDGELSDLSTSSSKKGSSQKQSKHKKRVKDSVIPEQYNNGSMYDVSYSPEKFNPDKSLFTDSEQSQSSPVKKKAMNGMEHALQKTPKVQSTLSDLSKNNQARQESGVDHESSKLLSKSGKSKKESKQKGKNSGEGKETLFEKLLQQAKRLIDFKDDHNS